MVSLPEMRVKEAADSKCNSHQKRLVGYGATTWRTLCEPEVWSGAPSMQSHSPAQKKGHPPCGRDAGKVQADRVRLRRAHPASSRGFSISSVVHHGFTQKLARQKMPQIKNKQKGFAGCRSRGLGADVPQRQSLGEPGLHHNPSEGLILPATPGVVCKLFRGRNSCHWKECG